MKLDLNPCKSRVDDSIAERRRADEDEDEDEDGMQVEGSDSSPSESKSQKMSTKYCALNVMVERARSIAGHGNNSRGGSKDPVGEMVMY